MLFALALNLLLVPEKKRQSVLFPFGQLRSQLHSQLHSHLHSHLHSQLHSQAKREAEANPVRRLAVQLATQLAAQLALHPARRLAELGVGVQNRRKKTCCWLCRWLRS